MPVPSYTEEDVKAAIAELKGKAAYEKEPDYDEDRANSPYLEDFDDEDDASAVTEEDDDDDDDMMESRPSAIEPAKPKSSGSENKKKK